MISRCGASAGALAHGRGGPEDRPHLHLVDLGMDQPEPHAARAEHRVALLERAHALELVLELAQLRRAAQARLGDPLHELVAIGQELVQRRIQQPDRDRQPRHRLEEPLEVRLLQRQQLVERGPPAGLVLGHDHALHLGQAVRGHEHVLGPAEPDALGAELARPARVLRRVRVGAHAQRAQLVAPAEHGLEARVHAGRHQRHVVERDLAGRAVDGDQVALVQNAIADVHLAGVQVDVQLGCPGDGRAAHASGHQRRVRGLAALGGEDPLRRVEARDVVGLGELADEDHRPAGLRGRHGVRRGEDDLPLGRARRGRHAARRWQSKRASGANVGCSSASSAPASIVAIASAAVISPSWTASTAKRTAAWAGRLALRVCSMYRRPSSTVNSVSCMSL